MLVTMHFVDKTDSENKIAQIGASNMSYADFAYLCDQTSQKWAAAAKNAFIWAAGEKLKPVSLLLDGDLLNLPFNIELSFTKEG